MLVTKVKQSGLQADDRTVHGSACVRQPALQLAKVVLQPRSLVSTGAVEIDS